MCERVSNIKEVQMKYTIVVRNYGTVKVYENFTLEEVKFFLDRFKDGKESLTITIKRQTWWGKRQTWWGRYFG